MESVIKLEFLGLCKWAKVNHSYDDIINAAKIKFPELSESTNIFIFDKDGVQLECDIIEDYLLTNKNAHLVFKTELTTKDNRCTNFNLTDLLSSPSTSGTNSTEWQEFDVNEIPIFTHTPLNDRNQDVPLSYNNTTSSSTLNLNNTDGKFVEELKKVINRNGENIFQEYERLQFLNSKTRKQLVNIVVSYMLDKFGTNISKENKTDVAKALVTIFPKLKDPDSKYGGYVSYLANQTQFCLNDNHICVEVKIIRCT